MCLLSLYSMCIKNNILYLVANGLYNEDLWIFKKSEMNVLLCARILPSICNSPRDLGTWIFDINNDHQPLYWYIFKNVLQSYAELGGEHLMHYAISFESTLDLKLKICHLPYRYQQFTHKVLLLWCESKKHFEEVND